MIHTYKRGTRYYININGAEEEITRERYNELKALPKNWWGTNKTDNTDY